MALIPDLPAASGLSDTDLLVIDTGSQTQKTTVGALLTKDNITGTFTAASGVSVGVTQIIKRSKNIVVVALYGTMPTGTGNITLGTVSGVPLPTYIIRDVCGVGTHNYDTEGTAYCILDTSGTVKLTKTVSSYTAFNVNFVYYLD